MERPRIAIFQANWPLQSQTLNCIHMLANADFHVDCFFCNTTSYIDLNMVAKQPQVRINDFGDGVDNNCRNPTPLKGGPFRPPFTELVWSSVDSKISKLMRRWPPSRFLIPLRITTLVPSLVQWQSEKLIHGYEYVSFIGIEKTGLIWAGLLGDRLGVPYVYYSLELYTWEAPEAWRSTRAIRETRAEAIFHRKSRATIVQDQEREEVLIKANHVKATRSFYVPVSLLGEPFKEKTSFLQERFSLQPSQIVILQFGLLYERRLSIELTRVAQDLPLNCQIVFHGYGSEKYIEKIRRSDHRRRILFSLEMVPSRSILELIASAHIGLVLYASDTANDRLTAFSSEKMALYLQCGLPIIAFDYPGYRRLLESYKCGFLIRSLEELPEAIGGILSSYEDFRENAFACFEAYYHYPKNFEKVTRWLKAINVF